MKKMIFLLALTLCIDVYATTKYTDYEHVGYTFEEKKDDELYKYEKVNMNRFYKLLENDIEYLEKGSSTKTIDESDYKKETYTSLQKPENYEYEQLIVIKGKDNYISNKLIIKILDEYKDIKINEIEIFNKDKKMSVTSTDVPNAIDGNYNTHDELTSDSFVINFSSYAYIDNLTIKIFFESEKPLLINYTIHNTSGLLKISKDLTLDNEAKNAVINTLKFDKYQFFLEENEFENQEITDYYGYEKIYYKHYTPIKEYYTISESSKLEGYKYDENESFAIYKIYKRDKIEPAPEIEPEKVIEYVIVKEAIPCDCEEVECEVEETKNSSTYPAVLDTTKDSTSITNLEELEKSDATKDVDECEAQPNWWLLSGLFFLIISVILTIIYYVDVKKQKEL